MKIGFALPHYDFSFADRRAADVATAVSWAARAEEAGFSSVWVSDHFFLDFAKIGGGERRFGSVDPFVTLTAIAARTSAVRLGTLVLAAPFRHPALVAKMAATLDVASGGRLDLGLGAGWYEPEFVATGIPFPSVGERIGYLEQYAASVGAMLSGSPASFRSDAIAISDLENDPQPLQKPRPPIWIGSKGGPRLARIIAEHADGWNTVWRITAEDYAVKARLLDDACTRTGRRVARSVGLLTLLGHDEAELTSSWERYRTFIPGAFEETSLTEFARDTLTGTIDEAAARIRAFGELGVEEVILSLGPVPFSIVEPERFDLVRELIAAVA